MIDWTQHLVITPILLPLLVSAAMLMFDERRRALRRVFSLFTALALIANAIALIHLTGSKGGLALTYSAGNWPVPFGIVLAADRLTALLLLLTSILGFAALIYSVARWDKAGQRFHALFLLMLMGVNGAFLTGDLFNLFVFFEVMLAASYGLALHGAGRARTRAGLHYIAINVATSLLFLIGVSLLYGVTGTLNMADLAVRIPAVPASDIMLLKAGAALLGVAFLVKAGMWPLNFWLPATYAAAAPPVAAMFAILSKVGIYVVLRLSSLMFGDDSGRAGHFADDWLLIGGIATIIYGTLGVLSARRLAPFAGYYLIISSGTLLAAIGTANTAVLAGALFYLVSSTLAIAAFYLLVEPIERGHEEEDELVVEAVFEDELAEALDEEENEIGVVIPATIAILGGGFAFCALLLAGLPPLSGFIAKFSIIDGMLRGGQAILPMHWVYIAAIIVSGLGVLMAATRAGIELIWEPSDRAMPNLRVVEAAPIALLLAICLGLVIMAGPVMRFMEQSAAALEQRELYTRAVLHPSGGAGR